MVDQNQAIPSTPQRPTPENEYRYQGIVESQNSLVVRLDSAGRYVYANQAYCTMFGRSPAELVGQHYSAFIHPDDLPSTADMLHELEFTPFRSTVEQRRMTANGLRWISWENSLVRDPGSHQAELQGVGHDITAQKRAEEMAIVERNLAIVIAQKSSLNEALPICLDLAIQVSEMDSGGIYLIDRPTQDLTLRESKGLSPAFIEKARRYAKESDRYKLVMQGAALYMRYVQSNFSNPPVDYDEGLRSLAVIPIQFNNKVIACMNVASHVKDEISEMQRTALENLAFQIGNMIERLQVQEDLAESTHQLQSMFDSLMDFVFVLDEFGFIIQVNQMVLRRLGYERDALIGQSVLAVHPPETRETAWRIISEMLAGRLENCSLDLMAKSGQRIPVETRVARGLWGNRDVLIGISRDITERIGAEATIREKVQEIEDFFSVSLDMLSILDGDGNFIRVNAAWETSLGFSPDEVLLRQVWDFVHPEDLHSTRSELSKLGKGQSALNFINRFQASDGTWHYLEWRAQSQGKLIYAAAHDVTERKTAEDMRVRQTDLLAYRNAFEEILTSISTRLINLPSSEIDQQVTQVLKLVGIFERVDRSYVFLLDDEQRIMSNSHEWCGEGIESSIDMLQDLPVDIFPWWIAKLKRLEEVYIPIVAQLPLEAQAERKILEDQNIKSVLVVPMVSHHKLIGFVGFDSVKSQRFWSADSILLIKMVSDILSNAIMRSKMENDLRQSEAHNRALLSAIPDLIFRIRRDGTFIDYKASTEEMLAIPASQIIGSNIKDIMEPDLAERSLGCIEQVLQTGHVQTMEYSMKVGKSSHTFEARFTNSGGDEALAIIRDISERARLEQMKSDFINRATHELRTPIATMLLMVNLLESEPSPEEREEFWGVLKSELDRERRLVEDLLTAGRLESDRTNFHFRPLDVPGLVLQTLPSLEISAREKNIALSLENLVAGAPAQINGDEAALTQVLVNLVGNAIKFTPNGGQVNLRLQTDSNGVTVSIIDTGIGIPSEDLPMLFSRFFRGTNAIQNEIQGTGIGLFIVRSIVDKHAGKIQVSSELGKGSQFDLWLPLRKS